MKHVEDFGRMYYAKAVQVTEGTGLFPDTLIAQGGLESDWGRSRHAQPDVNNLFGIKADTSWKGKVISSTTTEYVKGKKIKVVGTGKFYKNRQEAINAGANVASLFRVYSDSAEGMRDWVNFLKENPRYTTAGVFMAKNTKEQFEALKRGGYATAPNYANELSDVLATFKRYTANILDEISTKATEAKDIAKRNKKQIGIGVAIISLSLITGLLLFKNKIVKQ
jgi:flagellum-specific peptidoglycan hydrolase FlgJ